MGTGWVPASAEHACDGAQPTVTVVLQGRPQNPVASTAQRATHLDTTALLLMGEGKAEALRAAAHVNTPKDSGTALGCTTHCTHDGGPAEYDGAENSCLPALLTAGWCHVRLCAAHAGSLRHLLPITGALPTSRSPSAVGLPSRQQPPTSPGGSTSLVLSAQQARPPHAMQGRMRSARGSP